MQKALARVRNFAGGPCPRSKSLRTIRPKYILLVQLIDESALYQFCYQAAVNVVPRIVRCACRSILAEQIEADSNRFQIYVWNFQHLLDYDFLKTVLQCLAVFFSVHAKMFGQDADGEFLVGFQFLYAFDV